MPRMSILSTVELEEFEAPPQFTLAQQQHHFDPPLEVIRTLKRFKSPTNQVGSVKLTYCRHNGTGSHASFMRTPIPSKFGTTACATADS